MLSKDIKPGRIYTVKTGGAPVRVIGPIKNTADVVTGFTVADGIDITVLRPSQIVSEHPPAAACRVLKEAIDAHLDNIRLIGGIELKDAQVKENDEKDVQEDPPDLFLFIGGDAARYFNGGVITQRNRQDIKDLAEACDFQILYLAAYPDRMYFTWRKQTVPGTVYYATVSEENTTVLHIKDIRTAGRRNRPVSTPGGLISVVQANPDIKTIYYYAGTPGRSVARKAIGATLTPADVLRIGADAARLWR